MFRHTFIRLALGAPVLALILSACASGESTDEDAALDLTTGTGDTTQTTPDLTTDSGDTSTATDGSTTTDVTSEDGTALPDTTGGDTGTTTDAGDTSTATDATTTTATDMSTTVDMAEMDMSAPSMLGVACGATGGSCAPGSVSWPACANTPCGSGFCNLSFDNQGHCSSSCETDADCVAASGSIVGSNFTCVRAGTTSQCVPGSNAACTSDSNCSAGEVCKFGVVAGATALELGTTCQTPTQGGSAAGAACNDDPDAGAITRCANDMCLGSRCSSLCGGGAACGSTQLSCFQDFEVTASGDFTRDICLGALCASENDCTAPGFHCGISRFGDTTSDPIVGQCQFTAISGLKGLGEPCTEFEECETGFCLFETDTTGHCSAPCTSDSQCASSQLCAAWIVPLDAGQTTLQPVLACIDANGSQSNCTGNPSCGGGEVCRIYLQGTLVGGDPFDLNGFPVAVCADPIDATGGNPGDACGEGVGTCKNDYCVTTNQGSSFFCTAPCDPQNNDADCPGAGTCTAALPLYTRPGGASIDVNVCVY